MRERFLYFFLRCRLELFLGSGPQRHIDVNGPIGADVRHTAQLPAFLLITHRSLFGAVLHIRCGYWPALGGAFATEQA